MILFQISDIERKISVTKAMINVLIWNQKQCGPRQAEIQELLQINEVLHMEIKCI